MNKDSTQFMITEYDKISSAFFGLRDQINEWFKAYLTLVGFPLTILAAAYKIGDDDLSASLTNLPDVVSGLLLIVGLLGFFVTFIIISMRMEMILYARTINGVRRYFGQFDEMLAEFLILPTCDLKPPFYEAWRAMFWQVLLIGLINGIILTVGITSFFKVSWITGAFAGTMHLLLHWFVYWIMASLRERSWHGRFKQDLKASEI